MSTIVCLPGAILLPCPSELAADEVFLWGFFFSYCYERGYDRRRDCSVIEFSSVASFSSIVSIRAVEILVFLRQRV